MATASGNQPAALRQPLIELLVTASCPYRDAALALVQQVCGQVDGQAEIRVIQVADQPAAERLRFLGSPTIRVNGRDIEPGAEWNHEYVHGCWLYRGEHSLRGLPEAAWLRQALEAARPWRPPGPPMTILDPGRVRRGAAMAATAAQARVPGARGCWPSAGGRLAVRLRAGISPARGDPGRPARGWGPAARFNADRGQPA